MTDLTLEELRELETGRQRSADARNDLLLTTDEVLHWQSRYRYAIEDAAPALLTMARELVRLKSALEFLDDSGWAHPRYTEARNKFRTPGSSVFSVDQCIAFARELGWIDPLPPSERKGEG
jgi:hypothetical protein